MKYLFSSWDFLEKILRGRNLFLFLDYDGTLAPLRPRPNDDLLGEETRELLAGLSRVGRILLAVVSGRRLEDIKRKVGLDRIIYSGNHGLELSGPKVTFEELATPGYRRILQGIREDLFRKVPAIPGAVIEDKDIILTVHYRTVDPRQLPALKTIFQEATILYLVRNKIKIKERDMVFEVWPPVNWDKGKIVKWLLARQELAGEPGDRVPMYIGDDDTDEDAFRVLRPGGITVFVQGRPGVTAAEYYLKGQAEVAQLLRRLLEMERRGDNG